jgi:protein-S-isoprenylcysteine O-methyltransferase Ste14
MKEALKYILGYLVGGIIFILLIPYGFYMLSQFDYIFHGRVLICFSTLRLVLFSIIFITGAIFAIWSNIFLYKMGKGGPTDAFGVSISPQTKKLVTNGPYKYSRNPMVFGAFSLYTSVVIILNSITGFIFLIFFLILVILYLKLSEEKRLIRDFRDEYIEYKKKVPMIFPIKLICNHYFKQ